MYDATGLLQNLAAKTLWLRSQDANPCKYSRNHKSMSSREYKGQSPYPEPFSLLTYTFMLLFSKCEAVPEMLVFWWFQSQNGIPTMSGVLVCLPKNC
jgi:hypothetical protein